ncbi:MAG: 30S ribosomal protein S5 [Candidatus Peribacteraceae bacterium]
MAKSSKPDRKKGNKHGPRREPSEYEDVTIAIDRVTRVVKGGRRMRFRAVVVLGNKRGKVGLGTGKAGEVQMALQKATRDAKRHMIIVPMRGDSIPHEVNIKHKAARLRLMPASKGTGIIAGGPLRIVLDLAGIKDALSKSFGTTNKLVNAQAAIKALDSLRGVRKEKAAPKAATSEVKGHPEENLDIKTVTRKDLEDRPKGVMDLGKI